MSGGFTLSPLKIALPPGAFTGGGRDILRYKGAPLCGFTRGAFRPCLHPVWAPSGHVLTAEQPADHPHHRGIWCASDHVGLLMQGPDGIERYDYNFYVDEVFQGRAPGSIRQTALSLVAQNDKAALVEQALDWSGPQEWAAPDGRPVLAERRWTAVTLRQDAVILDITSEVTPAGDIAVALGPTRHAWFNARLALDIAIDPASAPVDDQSRRGAATISPRDTRWVDYSGPVSGGNHAGITVIPAAGEDNAWFVSDWGVITVGSIRDQARTLAPGMQAHFTCRIVAHDGPAPAQNLWTDTPFVAPDALAGAMSGDSE